MKQRTVLKIPLQLSGFNLLSRPLISEFPPLLTPQGLYRIKAGSDPGGNQGRQ